jgi:hypothetical protein
MPKAVIRSIHAGVHDENHRLRRLIPAWIISGFVHLVLLLLFVLIGSPGGASGQENAQDSESAVIETQMEGDAPPPNLDNDEIGFDPEVATNYNVTRIDEISVPGAVNENEQVGIENASPDVNPQTLPPPAGLGGMGTGAGIRDPNREGLGSTIGTAGGYVGGFSLRNAFLGRSGATRQQMLTEGGGNTATEAAVAAGTKWLVNHQFSDGHWDLNQINQAGKCQCTHTGKCGPSYAPEIAGTAFGLLPLLGAGVTHKVSNDKSVSDKVKNVDRGLKYLIQNQNAQGYFGGGMYTHGLASIVLCEAYGVTSDPALKGPAQRAINFIVNCQNNLGGWRYGPGSQDVDISVAGWQYQALKSAQMAGLEVPRKTLDAFVKWLDSDCTPDGSQYGYMNPSQLGPARTAIGLLCREYSGWGVRTPGLIEGIRYMSTQYPPPASPSMKIAPNEMYYYYYATQVVHHVGGPTWDQWNVKMRDFLVEQQDKGDQNPHQKGSFWVSPNNHSSHAGGRLMETSLCVLTLEVYYRHLPLYRRETNAIK